MLLDHLGKERNSEMFLRSGDPVPLLETCRTEGPGGARRFVSKNVPRRGKRPNVYSSVQLAAHIVARPHGGRCHTN